jgi:hypothetical protein
LIALVLNRGWHIVKLALVPVAKVSEGESVGVGGWVPRREKKVAGLVSIDGPVNRDGDAN